MNTTPTLNRTRRHLITFFGLAALLLPALLFVPSRVFSQGRPVPPPPRRDLPRGPLTPVRTISIDSSYLLCNSLQLQSARRVVWEPVLTSLGVTLRDRDVYGLSLDKAATEVCAGRLDSEQMNSAFGDLDRVMSGVEDRMFGRSLITSDERIKLSSDLMQAAYDEFQSRCFDNRGKEADLMIGRLPKTPDVGLGVEMQPASAALGRCNPSSGGKAPGTGVDIAFAQSEFQSCAAKALSSASQDCTDPAGQERSPRTTPPIEYDTGWHPVPDQPGREQRDHRENFPDGTHADVHQFRSGSAPPDYTLTEHYDAEGNLTDLTCEFVGTKFRIHLENSTRSREGPRDSAAQQRYVTEIRRANGPIQRNMNRLETAVGAALGVLRSVADPPISIVRIPPGSAGPSNQCQAMTSSSTGRMGLLRPQSTDSAEGSGGREFISGPDLILRCLCALGSRGAQLANQIAKATGSPGVSCSNNEWLRRVDCVANPRGPADGIRTECLGFLSADYGFDTPQTACDAAIQCPEGSQPIVVGPPGSSACRCSKEGSGTGPRVNCALIRCPPPGTSSSDPAVQACCGTPGDKPDKPSGPPIPPRPGEAPGSKPGGGNEKPEPFDPKKTGVESAGASTLVNLPLLFNATDLIGAATATGGKVQLVSVTPQNSPELKSLDWYGMSSGDQLSLRLDLPGKLLVNLYASFLIGPERGSLRVLVNGKEIGKPLELNFSSEQVGKVQVGQADFRQGSNTVTFVFSGKGLPTRFSLLTLAVAK